MAFYESCGPAVARAVGPMVLRQERLRFKFRAISRSISCRIGKFWLCHLLIHSIRTCSSSGVQSCRSECALWFAWPPFRRYARAERGASVALAAARIDLYWPPSKPLASRFRAAPPCQAFMTRTVLVCCAFDIVAPLRWVDREPS